MGVLEHSRRGLGTSSMTWQRNAKLLQTSQSARAQTNINLNLKIMKKFYSNITNGMIQQVNKTKSKESLQSRQDHLLSVFRLVFRLYLAKSDGSIKGRI